MFPGPPFCRVRLAQYQDIGVGEGARLLQQPLHWHLNSMYLGFLHTFVLGIRAVLGVPTRHAMALTAKILF